MKFLKPFSFLGFLFLTSCVGNMNPTGGNSSPDYPYFITTEPIEIKKIIVPKGTTLTYEESFFYKGKQDRKQSEAKLIEIKFPTGKPFIWGGVPITSIYKFFNSEMRGFSVYAAFDTLSEDKKTEFSKLWQSCSDDLGITVKNTDDWSFNKQNIADVTDCSVNYQRYFKEDAEQQNYLNKLYAALLKVDSK